MNSPDDYDPKSMAEYQHGRRAYENGKTRADCPHESGGSLVAGFNRRRHAWMVGHLDAEIEARENKRSGVK